MLCGVCSAAMLMGAVTFSASAAHPFTDVKGDQWYANFVDYAYNHGLMAGTSSSTFSPNQTMTRGMLVTVIHAIAGKPAPTTGNHFADVKANDYFAPAVTSTFSPNQTMTRGMLVTVIHAIAGKPAPTTGNHFADVKANDYFAPAVTWCYENGIVAGTGAKTFSPNQKVTREQMVAIMHFADVKANDYFAPAVTWCYENGIVAGTGAKTFSPNQKVTREQMVAIMLKFADHTGADVSKRADLSKYSDAGKIEGYAVDAFKWAVASGVISGSSDTTLSPKAGAVRAECAVVLQRYDELLENQKPEPEKPTEPKPTEPAPTEPKPTEPAPTEPEVTEPAPTEPKPTEPAPTEPEETKPSVHEHDWVHEHTDEVGHYEKKIVCSCGYECTETEAKAAGYDVVEMYWYDKHADPEEQATGINHSYDTARGNWIVDVPAFDKWTCSDCGVVATMDPTHLPSLPLHEHDWIWGSLVRAYECQDCGWDCIEAEAESVGMTLDEFYAQEHLDKVAPGTGTHAPKEAKSFLMYHPNHDHWMCDRCGIVTSINPIK